MATCPVALMLYCATGRDRTMVSAYSLDPANQHEYCTFVCRVMDKELSQNLRVCQRRRLSDTGE